jgi:site-specific recombinase XerC
VGTHQLDWRLPLGGHVTLRSGQINSGPSGSVHTIQPPLSVLKISVSCLLLKKKLSPHWLRHANGSHAHQRGAPAATIRDTLGHASLSTTDLYLSSAPTDGSSLYLKF